jgi:putative redox protein
MSKITAEYKGDMLSEVNIGKHRLTIDVPEDWGGKDRGPMPPQLLVASMASCTVAFVAHYCKNAGLDTSGMTVSVEFEKGQVPVRLYNFKITINLPNVTDEKRRKAIERSAKQCVVEQTMLNFQSGEIEINLG